MFTTITAILVVISCLFILAHFLRKPKSEPYAYPYIIVAILIGATIATPYIAEGNLTSDRQILSGSVVRAMYVPPWTEYYEYAVYRTEYYYETETYTDSKGRTQTRQVRCSREVFDHWEPTTRFHSEEYIVNDNINREFNVSASRYEHIKSKYGPETRSFEVTRSTGEHNSRQLRGDTKNYVLLNKQNVTYPVVANSTWTNKVKASSSIFKFAKVDENDARLYNYPVADDKFEVSRLFGTANAINKFAWDQMNARLGPFKRVNVIACGFGDATMDIACMQESKWLGGKKNDMVICVGGTVSGVL
jgi:hypothetical protein